MPEGDTDVMQLYRDYAQTFEKPGSLADFVANSMVPDSPYVAIYIPGGHGAMLGLPENKDLGCLLNWAHDQRHVHFGYLPRIGSAVGGQGWK
jgi:molecular chaperone Hsp31 and glyoxalase 3